MALSDIPEFIEVNPGDLVRAEHWNSVQRQMRDTLRRHHHTRAAGSPVNDAATTDEAEQLSTAEIADNAVTSAKLANGAVTNAKLADGSVNSAKLAKGSVDTAAIAIKSVTSSKISLEEFGNSSLFLAGGLSVEILVRNNVPIVKEAVYMPVLVIGDTSGAGVSRVEANIIYRQATGNDTSNDVLIKFTNHGTATAHIFWKLVGFTDVDVD